MKIMICGSMHFAREMMAAKKKLEKAGHTVFLPTDIDLHLNDPKFIDNFDLNYEHCLKNNVMWECFDLVAQSEAILVVNYPRNETPGYLGASSLMEIGLAYYLRKKIFLLYPTPKPTQARWAHEIEIIQPVILNGDLGKIK